MIVFGVQLHVGANIADISSAEHNILLKAGWLVGYVELPLEWWR